MKVFLSYSWKDEPLRHSVAEALTKIPMVELLYDTQRIKPGHGIHEGISNLIEAADVVIALVTKNSLASREVADELARADHRKKRIIPFIKRESGTPELPHYLKDTLS